MNRRVETMWDPLALTYTMTGGAKGMPADEAIRVRRVAQALFEVGVTAEQVQQANTQDKFDQLLKDNGVHDQGLPFSSKDAIQQRVMQAQSDRAKQDQGLAERVEWIKQHGQQDDSLYDNEIDADASAPSVEALDEANLEEGVQRSLEPLEQGAVNAAESLPDVPAAAPGDEGEGGTQVNEQVDAEGNNSLTRGRPPIPTNSRPGGTPTQWGIQSYGVIPNPSVYAGQIREAAVLRRHTDDAQYVRPEFAPQEVFFSTPVVGPAPYLGGIYT